MAERIRKRDRRDPVDPQEKREGDVLGISDAEGDLPGPKPREGTRRPKGIEVDPHPESQDAEPGKGATSIDMGAGGEGHAIRRRK
jgi:hypothetical protein